MKYKFYRPCMWNLASELLQICHKSEKWQWHHNMVTWCHCQIFWCCLFSLIKFNYWFLEFWKNFVYKGLTRNLEIGYTSVWLLPNMWNLGELGIVNLARISLMKCYWMLQNAWVTTFTASASSHQQGGT